MTIGVVNGISVIVGFCATAGNANASSNSAIVVAMLNCFMGNLLDLLESEPQAFGQSCFIVISDTYGGFVSFGLTPKIPGREVTLPAQLLCLAFNVWSGWNFAS